MGETDKREHHTYWRSARGWWFEQSDGLGVTHGPFPTYDTCMVAIDRRQAQIARRAAWVDRQIEMRTPWAIARETMPAVRVIA